MGGILDLSRRKIGLISKEIRNVCLDYYIDRIDREELKNQIKKIINMYQDCPGSIYQNVGMALVKWGKERAMLTDEEVLVLADEVDPRIRQAVENWRDKMLN